MTSVPFIERISAMKKLIAAGTAVAVLGLGGIGVNAAFAADSPAPSTPKAATAPHRRVKLAKGALAVAAKAIGISSKDLLKALPGKSVADVAKAHNVDPAKVTAALVAAGTKEIKAAVDAGKLSTERAAKLEANLPKRAETLVNKVRHPRRAVRRYAARSALAIAAKTIGIDQKTLVSEIKSGKTVADVANEHSVNPQAVIDALVNAGKARIQKAVTNGKIQQDRATKLEANLTQRVTKLVNDTPHRKAAAGGTTSS
jgi:transposase-like protein